MGNLIASSNWLDKNTVEIEISKALFSDEVHVNNKLAKLKSNKHIKDIKDLEVIKENYNNSVIIYFNEDCTNRFKSRVEKKIVKYIDKLYYGVLIIK